MKITESEIRTHIRSQILEIELRKERGIVLQESLLLETPASLVRIGNAIRGGWVVVQGAAAPRLTWMASVLAKHGGRIARRQGQGKRLFTNADHVRETYLASPTARGLGEEALEAGVAKKIGQERARRGVEWLGKARVGANGEVRYIQDIKWYRRWLVEPLAYAAGISEVMEQVSGEGLITSVMGWMGAPAVLTPYAALQAVFSHDLVDAAAGLRGDDMWTSKTFGIFNIEGKQFRYSGQHQTSSPEWGAQWLEACRGAQATLFTADMIRGPEEEALVAAINVIDASGPYTLLDLALPLQGLSPGELMNILQAADDVYGRIADVISPFEGRMWPGDQSRESGYVRLYELVKGAVSDIELTVGFTAGQMGDDPSTGTPHTQTFSIGGSGEATTSNVGTQNLGESTNIVNMVEALGSEPALMAWLARAESMNLISICLEESLEACNIAVAAAGDLPRDEALEQAHETVGIRLSPIQFQGVQEITNLVGGAPALGVALDLRVREFMEQRGFEAWYGNFSMKPGVLGVEDHPGLLTKSAGDDPEVLKRNVRYALLGRGSDPVLDGLMMDVPDLPLKDWQEWVVKIMHADGTSDGASKGVLASDIYGSIAIWLRTMWG